MKVTFNEIGPDERKCGNCEYRNGTEEDRFAVCDRWSHEEDDFHRLPNLIFVANDDGCSSFEKKRE